MSNLKTIQLLGHVGTPNPMKVEAVLLELELPYEMKDFDMSVLHTPVYEKYNPNGRVPALIDPNNGDFTIWESGAIIEYLIDTYDQAGKISHPSGNEKYLEKQWLHFQMSGQGPYYGQAVWFMKYHAEKLPSAVERYQKEALRVVKVRDTFLRENKKQYLVGDKLTYADIAFVPWDLSVFGFIITPEMADVEKEFPDFFAWHQRIIARPSLKKLIKARDAAMAAMAAKAAK